MTKKRVEYYCKRERDREKEWKKTQVNQSEWHEKDGEKVREERKGKKKKERERV